MRCVHRALIVVAVGCLGAALHVPAETVRATGERVAPAPITQNVSERDKVVGTYRFVGREVKSDDGTWRPTAAD